MAYIGTSPTQAVRTRFLYTATASQTTFSGADTQNLTLRYSDANFVDVYQNGVLLKGGGADYTATTTTSVVLATGATADDVIEIIVYDVFAVANLIKKDGDTVEGVINFNGKEITLDADFDTSITADTDDQIDIKIAGSDSLRIKANEIENVSGDFTLDVAGDITLDANGQQIFFAKGGATFGQFGTESTPSNYTIESTVSDGDIIFKGNDGGSTVTALTLDMSDAGTAQFGHDIELVQSNFINFKHQAGGTIRATISADSSDNLTFGTGSSGTERMRIDTSGRVGIGATPTAQFAHNLIQVGNQATLGANAALSTTGQTFLTHNLYYNTDGNLRVFNTSGANEGTIYQQIDGTHRFSNSAATTGTPTVTERMRIDSSGLVGIGNTSPSSQLAGAANLVIGGTSDADSGMTFVTATDGQGLIHFSDATSGDARFDGFIGYEQSNQAMKFGTAQTERMRIDSSGAVMVGTTNNDVASSSGTGNEGHVFPPGAPGQHAISNQTVLDLNRKTSDGVILNFRKNGSQVGTISTNGNTLPSDKNFKRDIKDLSIGLDLVSQLQPKSFNTIVDDENSPVMYGLIAQDLEVALEKVGVTKNSAWILQHEEKNDAKESDYSLDYGKLIPILINAIKELQAKVTALESK